MKWNRKGHEFDGLGTILCNPNNVYLIWGAGTIGINSFRDLNAKINVIGFIDSDKNKIGRMMEGKQVFAPEAALREFDNAIILIATGWYKEVSEVLNKYEKVENKDYFNIDLFVTIFMMYCYDELVLNKLSFLVTQRCSLKCKYCGAFVPYIKNPKDFSVDFLINELNILFRYVKKVNTLNLYGGDTFMHIQLDELLERIGEDFSDNIGTVNIFTNAVILPSGKRLNIIKKYDMMIRFTDYSENVSHLQKKDEMISLLETEGIRYDCAKFSTWYDGGYPQMSNKIKERELEQYFNNCFVNMCQILCDNKLYLCTAAYFADKINYIPADDSDSFSIYDITEENKRIFMEFYLGYSEKGYVALCRACNGGQNTNQIPIPVAEQL